MVSLTRVFRVSMDPTPAVQNAKRLNRSLETTGQKVNATRQSVLGLGTALRGLAILGVVQELRQLTDTSILLDNRIRLVTDSTAELNVIQDRLFNLAQETRTSLQGTVELYARLARSTRDSAVSSDELLTVTKAVNQAIQISGATAQEASNAIIQFSQGLASGNLQGEELRSVLEQVPRLAIALADGLNLANEELERAKETGDISGLVEVTIGSLRKLGSEGELETLRIIEALKKTAPELAAEFEQIVKTSDQAIVQLKNSLLNFAGELEEEIGQSRAFNAFFDSLREGVDFVTSRVPDIGDAFDLLASDIGVAITELGESFDFFGNEIASIAEQLGLTDEEVEKFKETLEKDFPRLLDKLEQANEDPFGFIVESLGNAVGNVRLLTKIIVGESLNAFEQLAVDTQQVLLDIGDFLDVFNLREAFGADIEAERERLAAEEARIEETLSLFREGILKDFEELEGKRTAILKENAAAREKIRREEAEAAAGLDLDALFKDEELFGNLGQAPGSNIDPKATESANKLLEKFREQTEQLAIRNATNAQFVKQELRVLEINKLRGDIRQADLEALEKASDELAAQEGLADRRKDEEAIEKAELQLRLLQAQGEERFKILAIQQLGLDADQDLIDKLAEILEKTDQFTEKNKQLGVTLEELDRQFTRGLVQTTKDFVLNFNDGIDSLEDNLLDLISNIAAEIIASELVGLFLNTFGGGTGIFQNLFGKKGEGGFVNRNEPVIVGERGEPEIFVPKVSGFVMNSKRMKEDRQMDSFGREQFNQLTDAINRNVLSRGPQVVMNVTTPDANSFRQSENQILSRLQTAGNRALSRNG